MDGRPAGEPRGQAEDPQRERQAATEALKPGALKFGVRVVAVVEAAKGLLVLAVGIGLHRLVHHDVRAFAVHLVHQFHLNPASHYPSIFLHAMENVSDARLQMLALGAAAYSGVRFAEAYGLWLERRWAEWLAVLGGAIYIPFELYHLWLHVTVVKLGLLAVNVAIVAYMSRVLWKGKDSGHD